MTRSRTEEEDVTDQFLNYDGEVTVEAEGTSVDNAEQDTSATNKIQEETDTTSKVENQNEDPSNEKENEDPKESVVQDQAKVNEKSDKDDEESEVYEVETVLDHNKRKNKTYYLIKWKGYSEEESTWEAEDNVFAEELVKEYWANHNTDEAKQKETRKGRKRSAAPPTPTKKESKKARTSITPKKAKTARVKIDEEFDHDEDWESLVSGVETVTRDDKTGELLVYLKWKNGDTSRHPAKEANIKCPQKMLKFYEQRLTFAAPQPKS
ncbi:chromo shadow domain-containing protein [Glomus cerebriforme]|uniref:Chromo shadow domain-containing protein n=1 Tax=Glomus cerebriforme TaxID=658196 RepID=A0A397STC1_9GLOM|nr:chromo shadow domain-containing protein [Glomus cerebriforme]